MTARGSLYLALATLQQQIAQGSLVPINGSEEYEKGGELKSIKVESERYVESDAALLQRVLGRKVGGKQNILVFNDEAHHA